MGEHTPGPWMWWTSNSWRRLARDDRRGGPFAWVLQPIKQNDGHPDCLVSEADMGLIAAAPDLLDAAKDALRIAREMGESIGVSLDAECPGSPDVCAEALCQNEGGCITQRLRPIHAAIAKAETPVSR